VTRVAAFLLLPLVSSCLLTSEPIDFRQRALDETNRREGLWEAEDVHDYDFDYVLSCECSSTATQPVTIEVRNDQVSRVLTASAGTEVDPAPGVSWPTVDSLFIWARETIANRDLAISVTFDTTYHFPARVAGQANLGSGAFIERLATNLTEIAVPAIQPAIRRD
jgi:hypothetical protein